MKEHDEQREAVAIPDSAARPKPRRLENEQRVPRYDFSQLDFSQPEIRAPLGRAYAILLTRAQRRIQEKSPADYTDTGADAPKERRVSNE